MPFRSLASLAAVTTGTIHYSRRPEKSSNIITEQQSPLQSTLDELQASPIIYELTLLLSKKKALLPQFPFKNGLKFRLRLPETLIFRIVLSRRMHECRKLRKRSHDILYKTGKVLCQEQRTSCRIVKYFAKNS